MEDRRVVETGVYEDIAYIWRSYFKINEAKTKGHLQYMLTGYTQTEVRTATRFIARHRGLLLVKGGKL